MKIQHQCIHMYYYSATALSVLSHWHMSMMIIVENYKGYSHTLPTMHIRQGDSSIIGCLLQLLPFVPSARRKEKEL